MDIVTDADTASAGLDRPGTILLVEADTLERTTSVTPVGIRSSPPTLPARVVEVNDASTHGEKSDSDAETVVLPGVNGHSPSKARKVIKLEDGTSIKGEPSGVDIDIKDSVGDDAVEKEHHNPAPSNLGKRKRSKHSNASNEHSRNGNSSGLSSVPSSPLATTRSSLSKPAESESDVSRSSSPRANQEDKTKFIDKKLPRDAGLDTEGRESKEQRKRRRQDVSSSDMTGKQSRQVRDSRSPLQGTNPSRNRTRSASPHPNVHRRSASNGAINGLSYRKKKIPAPLRSTRDRRSTEDHSDDGSSVGESPHPRQSRTRNLATPPTGDSSASLAKMGPHKKRHPFGRTVLVDFCDTGNYEMAKQHLEEHPDHIDVADPAGNTPVQCASLKGFEDIVKLLIDAGCNVNCINNEKESPLFDAVENGHLGVVKMLLDAGANPRARNQEGEEPIDVVDDDCEDAAAIRTALRAARLRSAHTQPSIPVQSAHPGTSTSTSGRTQRSTKTGEHHLWAPKDKIALRKAAARGDVETAGNVLVVLADETFDDPESLVAAARGGHEEVLNLLLGFSANPDPEPLEDRDWEHATPILAAIGGDNIKVIELLLSKVDDGAFDPTKRYHGSTYHEIARQRRGPLWQEEERILRAAFDNYTPSQNARPSASSHSTTRQHQKKLSDSSGRPNGSKSKDQRPSEPYQSVKQESRGASSSGANSTPVKRGPGRPRKDRDWRESSVTLESEVASSNPHREKEVTKEKEKENGRAKRPESDSAPIPSDSEPTKPRRKLMSRQELNSEREKMQRRASVASITLTTSSTTESVASDSSRTKSSTMKSTTPRLINSTSEPDITSDKIGDRARSIKREDSKDRIHVMRGESPVKRARSSLTPPSESQDSSSLRVPEHGSSAKRRRVEVDSKSASRAEGRWSSSPDYRTTSDPPKSSTERSLSHRDLVQDQKHSRYSQESHHKKARSDKVRSFDSVKGSVAEGNLRDDVRQDGDNVLPSEEKAAADRKAKQAAKAKEQAEADALIKREAEAAEAAEAARAKEQAEAEALLKRQAEEELEKQRLEEARLARIAKEQRELEEAMKRQQEEAERLEQQRREEAEAQRRAQEEQRRLYDEQRRARIAEQRAEHERRERERLAALEAARLAKLPLLLRWFDGLQQTATNEIASKFRVIQGVRYDTIKAEATGNTDARDQWLLNTQVALLLGEKDLSLSRCKALLNVLWKHY
jgi:ankyrin repeat protein